MACKFVFSDSLANFDTSTFLRKTTSNGNFKDNGILALRVAARRVVEIVRMTVDGENIGPKRERDYLTSAAFFAWRAMEDAALAFRIASETSDDDQFIHNTKTLFEFAPYFFNEVVENPYLPKWQKERSPAFRYAFAIRHGDKTMADRTSRLIADVGFQFSEIAVRFDPKNEDLKKSLKYCYFMRGINRAEKQGLATA